jgi:hypothetical protein
MTNLLPAELKPARLFSTVSPWGIRPSFHLHHQFAFTTAPPLAAIAP